MLVGQAGAGSERLKSMHLVSLAYKSSWKPRKECCMALKLIWRLVNTVQRRPRCIQNGVICVEVDRGITRSKSDIVDIYREKSRPENWTLWYPHGDCQRSGQQALRFDTLNSIWEVVGEPGEAVKPRLLSLPYSKRIKYILFLSNLHTIPQNEKVKTGF